MENNNQSIKMLWLSIKKLISLNVDNAKLTIAEKLTLFSAAVAFYFVAMLLGVIVVFFVSMALCDVLSKFMETHYVYLIMAAIYVVLLILGYVMKNVIFLNPISRFVSKLLLTPPQDTTE